MYNSVKIYKDKAKEQKYKFYSFSPTYTTPNYHTTTAPDYSYTVTTTNANILDSYKISYDADLTWSIISSSSGTNST